MFFFSKELWRQTWMELLASPLGSLGVDLRLWNVFLFFKGDLRKKMDGTANVPPFALLTKRIGF